MSQALLPIGVCSFGGAFFALSAPILLHWECVEHGVNLVARWCLVCLWVHLYMHHTMAGVLIKCETNCFHSLLP